MVSNVAGFIKDLQKSNLVANCPNCSQEFSLSKVLLFDGTKKFPETAEITKLEWEKKLEARILDLKELRRKTADKSEISAISGGAGKILEKILPAHKNFDMVSADWRFLEEPIDIIAFKGLSENKIDHITFMDVKSGKAPLQSNQRQIRDAVNDHNVKWRQL